MTKDNLGDAWQIARAIVGSPELGETQFAAQSYYIVLTEPNREMTAQANLTLRKIPFYLPTIFKPARISARRQAKGEDHPDILVPLFPGIMFIAADVLSWRYELICATPGMRSRPLMQFGEREALLTSVGMQAVRYIEAGEREIYLRAKGRKLPDHMPKVGEEVRVLVDEVMGGLTGKVIEVDERGRITILAEIMKRMVPVKMTAAQIGPV
ncbi:transcription termination/antitermination NusG family protein [Bradyrhizobium sp. SZCCHNR1020]|uniref:transcription termination/antitermination NusG family protein n=1 Tax=Bradyrhizobium sp. SZCCHNR1020 TaxID=3057343 RepID=UPI0029170F2F|nr:transcription termination/antitermination NusG family protein [Bradyrhizobium sp. SZCCHNR1020]